MDEFLRTLEETLRELHRNLIAAWDLMKSQADQNCRETILNVGDYVYLKLHLYRQQYVVFRGSLKLAPRLFRPYKILARLGSVVYKLELPVGSLIHDVFHISLLKKHLGPDVLVSPSFPPTNIDYVILTQL